MHGGGWHGGFFGPGIVIAGPGYYDSCTVQTWVPGPNGPVLRWVNRCY
jgi:hypothetical protein